MARSRRRLGAADGHASLDADVTREAPLPLSIQATPAASAGAPQSRRAAAVWDAVVAAEGSSFFDGYPRDVGRSGPVADDEKAKVIREAFEVDASIVPSDRTAASRAQIVCDAARRLGLGAESSERHAERRIDPAPGAMATVMLLGMQLVSMLASGENTEESLERQPSL